MCKVKSPKCLSIKYRGIIQTEIKNKGNIFLVLILHINRLLVFIIWTKVIHLLLRNSLWGVHGRTVLGENNKKMTTLRVLFEDAELNLDEGYFSEGCFSIRSIKCFPIFDTFRFISGYVISDVVVSVSYIEAFIEKCSTILNTPFCFL